MTVAGCAATPQTQAVSSESPPTSSRPASSTVDAAQCTQVPPPGHIDRTGYDLRFTHGRMLVAITPLPGPLPTTPAPARSSCHQFAKSGNAAPDVPPDSLLFTFTGPGADGAQVEFLAGDLTGGVLPPIGDVRPTVGPLTGPINAQIGVSANGTYHHATTCQLALVAISPTRAGGTFTCAAATESDANPFAPSDDVTHDDESAAEIPGSTSTPGSAPPATTTRLTGWFELTP